MHLVLLWSCPRIRRSERRRSQKRAAAPLRNECLERAIRVIYRPDTELIGYYFHAGLPDQFDAMLHYGYTRAVEPSERITELEMD